MGRTVEQLVGRWALTEPAPEQPLELPVPVLAHSARDRLIAPNTSSCQPYSLVLVLTSGTCVFPESIHSYAQDVFFLKPPKSSSLFLATFSENCSFCCRSNCPQFLAIADHHPQLILRFPGFPGLRKTIFPHFPRNSAKSREGV